MNSIKDITHVVVDGKKLSTTQLIIALDEKLKSGASSMVIMLDCKGGSV